MAGQHHCKLLVETVFVVNGSLSMLGSASTAVWVPSGTCGISRATTGTIYGISCVIAGAIYEAGNLPSCGAFMLGLGYSAWDKGWCDTLLRFRRVVSCS